MSDQPTPTTPPEADAAPSDTTPTDAPPTDTPVAEEGLANTAPDTPQPDEPTVSEPTATQAAVADASTDLAPGQTVTTSTDGNAHVTGAPRPEAGSADHELSDAGSSTGIATPLGLVRISYTVDDRGVGEVSVVTEVDNENFQHVAEALLLRSAPS